MINSRARSGDREVAVGTSPTKVSGAEPALAVERLGGRVGSTPVALENVGATYLNLARLLVFDWLTADQVHDPRLLAGEGLPNCSGSALTPKRVREIHARLGHPVALQDALAKASLEIVECLHAEGRGTRDVQPNRRGTDAARLGLGDQAGVHRRNAEEHARLTP